VCDNCNDTLRFLKLRIEGHNESRARQSGDTVSEGSVNDRFRCVKHTRKFRLWASDLTDLYTCTGTELTNWLFA
jgi:hypothetical protein